LKLLNSWLITLHIEDFLFLPDGFDQIKIPTAANRSCTSFHVVILYDNYHSFYLKDTEQHKLSCFVCRVTS